MNKTLLFLLSMLFLSANSNAAEKIVMYDKNAEEAVLEEIIKTGGKVIKKYEFIDAALVYVPDSVSRSISKNITRGLRSIDDNKYRYWLEDFYIPSASQVKGKAKHSEAKVSAAETQASSAERAVVKDAEIPWGVKRVNAAAAWRKNYSRVKVAVLDTGINYKHQDLKSAINGFNAIDNTKTALDDHGHGTHVAGTIAAAANGIGVVGIAPSVKVYAVKVLDNTGGGKPSYVADGIEWSIKNKMNVLNLSLSSYWEPVVGAMVKAAYKAGITIVAAAGNKGNQVRFPANMDETIGVGATGIDDTMAGFSCRGREIDFIAPGVDIVSTTMDGKWNKNSGTSMAAPHITGLAVLAIASGAKGPEEVKSKLKEAASPLTTIPYAWWQGAGMIDAAKIK